VVTLREFGVKTTVDFLPNAWVLFRIDEYGMENYWTGRLLTNGSRLVSESMPVTTRHLYEAEKFDSPSDAYSRAKVVRWRCPKIAWFRVGRRPNRFRFIRKRW